MIRFGLCLLGVLVVGATARADDLIEPGQWTVTTKTTVNGAISPPQAKARCITPDQAADVAKTFGPVSGGVNSSCGAPQSDMSGHVLTWKLQCRGQLDMDVEARFNFDGPRHYSAIIVSKGSMAGRLVSNVRSELEGARSGECTQ
jgi:hypothetical protein